jgi:hypothetical protein
VGYHNKRMPDVQLDAIRDLVKELKAMYRIPDERVVCHSHVAYGAPNRWHKFKHRGRKRCGMLFAMPSVRRRLDLNRRPAFDPDTMARRLRNADDYLRQVLYGSVDTMAPFYGNAGLIAARKPPAIVAAKPLPTTKPLPAAKTIPAAKPNAVPQPPVAKKPVPVALPKPAAPAPVLAAAPTSIAELKARGYALKGMVSKEVSAARIAGSKWNAADTYYTIRNKVIPGNMINEARIERGMGVWMKK